MSKIETMTHNGKVYVNAVDNYDKDRKRWREMLPSDVITLDSEVAPVANCVEVSKNVFRYN